MENLRSMVIMKTDLAGFADRAAKPSQQDLSELLDKRKDMVSQVVARHAGTTIKGDENSFWITFSSVTTAARAAIEIQRDLQHAQVGSSDEDRLGIKIVITFGDVLHKEGDIFGDAVNLATRIQSITPAGETYLSHSAALVINNAEISVDYVNEFDLKGIAQRERIYRVHKKNETRIIKDQVILISWLVFFDKMMKGASKDIKAFISEHEGNAKQICESHGGIVHQTLFSGHIITFNDAEPAIMGVKQWMQKWNAFLKKNNWQNYLYIGLYRGGFRIFRSDITKISLKVSSDLARALHQEDDRNSAVVSAKIYQEIEKTDLAASFREFDPFQLGKDDAERKSMKKSLLDRGFEEGEKAYELLL
jgi:class 3 adenylate cyclase